MARCVDLPSKGVGDQCPQVNQNEVDESSILSDVLHVTIVYVHIVGTEY